MPKITYDLVFGLGPACSCTMSLRRAGLQHLSFPFDWIGPKTDTPEYERDVLIRAELIASEFGDWIRPEDFTPIERRTAAPRDSYFNERLRLLFLHDFPMGSDFSAEFPKVREKYRRRCNRLLELIRSSRRILLLRVDRPDLDARTDAGLCREAVRILNEKFAPAAFELLLLHCEHGRGYADRLETDHGGGVRSVVFDYDDRSPGAESFQPDIPLLGRVLSERFAVRDYRTAQERADHARSERLRTYAKLGVSNWWQYRLARWGLLGAADRLRIPLARLVRQRFEQIVPLGYNCETAFRFYRRWGFLESSLFAWTSLSGIGRLIAALGNLEAIGGGEMRYSPASRMWTCVGTDICFHGRLKADPNLPQPTPEELEADRTDLLGRIAHLKKKFVDYATNEKSTLFVYKPRPEDAGRPGFNDDLDALERALERLGARNWKLLVVCERSRLKGMRESANRVLRAVRRYSPKDDVTNRRKGDPAGWAVIYTEFAPARVLPKRHAFKFE